MHENCTEIFVLAPVSCWPQFAAPSQEEPEMRDNCTEIFVLALVSCWLHHSRLKPEIKGPDNPTFPHVYVFARGLESSLMQSCK